MSEKWKKIWKGVAVLSFGIRTFLIGNLLFDMWPACIYQISMMKFGKDNPKPGRAAFSLILAYISGLITILEMFVMFYVSHRISVFDEKKKNEIEKMLKEEKMKGVKEGGDLSKLQGTFDMDEDKEEIMLPKKTFSFKNKELGEIEKNGKKMKIIFSRKKIGER